MISIVPKQDIRKKDLCKNTYLNMYNSFLTKYLTVSDSSALKTVSGIIQGNSSMFFMSLVTFLSPFGKTLILLVFNRRAACIPGQFW